MLFLNQMVLFVAVVLVSAVQIIVKARLNAEHGVFPTSLAKYPEFIAGALRDPWLWLAGVCLVTSGFLWYFAVSRIPLSVAFTFASLSYPLIIFGGQIFLGETVVIQQYLGCALIVSGIILIGMHA